MDEKEAKSLEQKADEVVLKTLLTQFGLNNNKFTQDLEQCCSIHSTAFTKWAKQPNGRKDNEDAINNEEGKDGFVSAHIVMDSAAAILAAHVSNDCVWETTKWWQQYWFIGWWRGSCVLIRKLIIENPEVAIKHGKPGSAWDKYAINLRHLITCIHTYYHIRSVLELWCRVLKNYGARRHVQDGSKY